MQYTIEARELTNDSMHRPTVDASPRRMMVDADEAISPFVRQERSELVSLNRPATGRESIATVKKDDSVFLVRVYAA